MQQDGPHYLPRWTNILLITAGFYNLLWGTLVILIPDLLWSNLEVNSPSYIELWECIGLMVAGFGIGYLFAAIDPARYWPFIFIGFLGKLIIPIGFLIAWSKGNITGQLGWTVLFSDGIWLLPFGIILHRIHRQFVFETRPLEEELMMEDEFHEVETSKGWKLEELSHRNPLVIVFLRHFGCPFSRETLVDIAKTRSELQEHDLTLVLIHMSETGEAEQVLKKYGLADVHHISDPDRHLYRYFGLRRGFIHQVLGPKALFRLFQAGILKGHGLDPFFGDFWQMPGVFLFDKGRIRKRFIHQTPADRPDFSLFIRTETVS